MKMIEICIPTTLRRKHRTVFFSVANFAFYLHFRELLGTHRHTGSLLSLSKYFTWKNSNFIIFLSFVRLIPQNEL